MHSPIAAASDTRGNKNVLVTALDAACPIHHIESAEDVDRLSCEVSYAGALLGNVELPIFDGFVSGYLIEDAVAAEFAWEILGRYLRRTVYPLFAVAREDGTSGWSRDGCLLATEARDLDESVFHDTVGWTVFLQELWGRPSFSNERFYAFPGTSHPDGGEDCEASFVVEVSEDIPSVPPGPAREDIAVTVGGAFLGLVTTAVPAEGIQADAVLSAITYWSGFELCRVAVREALVGKPIEGPALRKRLAESARRLRLLPDVLPPQYDGELLAVGHQALTKSLRPATSTVVIPRFRGPIGSNASRRAHLPTDLLSDVLETCDADKSPVVRVGSPGVPPRAIVYAPELIPRTSWPASMAPPATPTVEPAGPRFGRAHWEGLFARTPDPWRYGNTYEQDKYEQTLSLVPDGITTALELASAEGFFTEKLAPRVKRLVSSDISQIAMEHAAQSCTAHRNVQFRRIDFVQDELPPGFDLVVCSEVLYYIGGLDVLQNVAKKIERALNPGGYFLTAHANQVIDAQQHPGFDWGVPFGAQKIGEVFASTHPLKLVKELRTPLYRVQLYQKSDSKLDAVEIIEKELSFPLPPHIAQMALWNGAHQLLSVEPDCCETKRLPILTYHRVASTGSMSLAPFRVTPKDFEAQMRYLKETGYYTTTFDRWRIAAEHKKSLPGRAVIITFDDGYADFADFAWPILKRFEMTPIVFLVAGLLGGSNVWDRNEDPLSLMTPETIAELQSEGVVFGSHSLTHRSFITLTAAEIAREHLCSRCVLEEILGRRVEVVSYPYGANDAVVRHLAGACGYLYGVTTRQSVCRFTDSLLGLPRIEINGDDNLERFIAKLTHDD